jgi:hypothetical protein
MPDRARLSRGRNNGDRSWSLMRDDLDDLRYLPPEGVKTGHTLGIRIINLDTEDGATLAVLDFPVAASASSAEKRAFASAPAPAVVENPELPLLREECSRVKAALGQRDRELAELRQTLEQTRSDVLRQDDALSSARVAWQSELDSRLAQAHSETTSKVEAGRAAWLAELNGRIEESRARWQREAETALTRAKEAWRAEEAAKFAQAESMWREQAAHAVADAKAQRERAESALARSEAEAARMSGDGAALRRLREELAEANTSLGARARELSDARKSLEESRAEGLRSKSELAAARAAWHAELEKRLAEVRAEIVANLGTPDLEDRVQGRIEQARDQWRQDGEAALSRAREAWRSEEAVRLARAEAQWRDQSARSLAESSAKLEKAETALARAHAHALHESTDAADLRRVREELAETRVVLQDREQRLSEVRVETKRARERWKAESDVALKNAQEAWKAEEAYRISVVRGDWQRDLHIAQDAADNDNQAQSRGTRRLVLDGLLAAALAVAVVVLYPSVAPMLSGYFPGLFPQAAGNASAYVQPVKAAAQVPAASVSTGHVDVALRGANVHSDPSLTGAIVTTLARGTKVTQLEQRGSWVRVQIANGGQKEQGWVFGRYLKDAPPGS